MSFLIFQCLIHSNWFKEDDACAKNPRDCENGLTVSIWEKNTIENIYGDNLVLAETDPEKLETKYLVSSGAFFDRETAYAIPGFAIYRRVRFF